MKNLENYGVLEMNLREMREVDGGIEWWMYLIAPGSAYIIGKFEQGLACN